MQKVFQLVLQRHFESLHAGKPEIHNGADDNASGIAAMLQLAEHLKNYIRRAAKLI